MNLESISSEELRWLQDKRWEAATEWKAQEEITELVRIFGRDIAQEKVSNMLLIAFKETGR